MTDIKVIDNFLSDQEFQSLVSAIVQSQYFPWYYSPVAVSDYDIVPICSDLYNFQLAHTVYYNNIPTSQYYELLTSILPKLNIKSLIFAKFNFNTVTEKVIEHCYHNDSKFDCTTAVYYLNTCDGYTKFENGDKVDSIANRIAIFPSSMKHTGTTCTNQQGRYVLNLNYF